MSVGLFLGIAGSYVDEAQGVARAHVDAINQALMRAGLPRYVEPPGVPDPSEGGRFGRSALDHDTARGLVALAMLGGAHGIGPHLALLEHNPSRVAFVPQDFPTPLPLEHTERLHGRAVRLLVGSAPALHRELVQLAPRLGIPLHARGPESVLDADTVERINDLEPLYDGDDLELAEGERTTWLLLFEGTRLALVHAVALSLAG